MIEFLMNAPAKPDFPLIMWGLGLITGFAMAWLWWGIVSARQDKVKSERMRRRQARASRRACLVSRNGIRNISRQAVTYWQDNEQ